VLDMDLHFARAQQRWCYAADELAAGETLNVEQLADDFSDLPQLAAEASPADVKVVVDSFFAKTRVDAQPAGGVVECADAEPGGDEGGQQPATAHTATGTAPPAPLDRPCAGDRT
jgi:hypothetical protein